MTTEDTRTPQERAAAERTIADFIARQHERAATARGGSGEAQAREEARRAIAARAPTADAVADFIARRDAGQR